MERSLSRRTASRVAIGFSVLAFAALVIGAILLASSQSGQRDDLRERHASRVGVAGSLIDSLFRVAYAGQARQAAEDFGGDRVTRSELDRSTQDTGNVFRAVVGAKGEVIARSTGTPDAVLRDDALRKAAIESDVGYALSSVGMTGGQDYVANAVPFRAKDGTTRLLVSGTPAKAFRDFLDGSLAPLASLERRRAFITDGNGHLLGTAAPKGIAPSPPDNLVKAVIGAKQGWVTVDGERRFFADAPLASSRWKIALATPESALYSSVSGASRWAPWLLLAFGAVALAAIAVLLLRLARQSERLHDTNAELARSNADLEQFAYAASHDLSAPLQTVDGFAQLLERRSAADLDDKGRIYLTHLRTGVGRMQQLIDDLLVYSRVGRGPIAADRVELDDVLEDVLASLHGDIEERRAFVTHDELPAVRGERGQLAQVLQNLVGNALKFTAPNVTPRVHVGATHDHDGAWRISVTDNGIGVGDQTESIFKMFGRLHPDDAYPGTGIGLALVKRIVERHGGRIWVDPAQEGGSVFTFTLPDRTPAAAPEPDRERVPA